MGPGSLSQRFQLIPPHWTPKNFSCYLGLTFTDAKDAPQGVFTLDWSLADLLASDYIYRDIGSEGS
jgi:hypothetical protein